MRVDVLVPFNYTLGLVLQVTQSRVIASVKYGFAKSASGLISIGDVANILIGKMSCVQEM